LSLKIILLLCYCYYYQPIN